MNYSYTTICFLENIINNNDNNNSTLGTRALLATRGHMRVLYLQFTVFSGL